MRAPIGRIAGATAARIRVDHDPLQRAGRSVGTRRFAERGEPASHQRQNHDRGGQQTGGAQYTQIGTTRAGRLFDAERRFGWTNVDDWVAGPN